MRRDCSSGSQLMLKDNQEHIFDTQTPDLEKSSYSPCFFSRIFIRIQTLKDSIRKTSRDQISYDRCKHYQWQLIH